MTNVNFARKWRSKTFDELIGQELSVRILKNTLYLNHFFPVYLFHGQRGCGKTSTARIFATAINCQQLNQFQQDPSYSLPCLACSSCKAMAAGNHPDFIEIDGASHTGVDNIRSLIDAALLMPVLGRKKIYLIDEAHMLSKAAFNAFLKMLEEPPQSVLFILATTEIQKIIDTVKSRCFQLFFSAVNSDSLVHHLAFVCDREHISYEKEGLIAIAQESDGSVRDALNLLEQIRFSNPTVTKKAVLAVLGSCDDQTIFSLLDYCLHGKSDALINLLQQHPSFYAESLWYGFVRLIHDILAVKHNLAAQSFAPYSDKLSDYARQLSLSQLSFFLEYCYTREFQFKRAHHKDLFIMNVFIQLCFKHTQPHEPVSNNTNKSTAAPTIQRIAPMKTERSSLNAEQSHWQLFLQEIQTIRDPLVESIFKQAHCKELNIKEGTIILSYAKQFDFFQDLLLKAEQSWKPVLDKVMGTSIRYVLEFDQLLESPPVSEPVTPVIKKNNESNQKEITAPQKKIIPLQKNTFIKKTKKHHIIDVSNKQQWKFAPMVLEFFPGVITQLQEGSDE